MSEEKKVNFKRQGKLNRQRGALFEKKVRDDLEKMGWIVDKWMNTVDFDRDCLTPARRKYNPFNKALSIGNGFPDFICFKSSGEGYEVIAVEVKLNGALDKFEKGQCMWLLSKRIFHKILIARKTKVKNRVVIEYIDVKEKYGEKV